MHFWRLLHPRLDLLSDLVYIRHLFNILSGHLSSTAKCSYYTYASNNGTLWCTINSLLCYVSLGSRLRSQVESFIYSCVLSIGKQWGDEISLEQSVPSAFRHHLFILPWQIEPEVGIWSTPTVLSSYGYHDWSQGCFFFAAFDTDNHLSLLSEQRMHVNKWLLCLIDCKCCMTAKRQLSFMGKISLFVDPQLFCTVILMACYTHSWWCGLTPPRQYSFTLQHMHIVFCISIAYITESLFPVL